MERHVARMGEQECAQGFVGKAWRKQIRQDIGRRIILKLILKNWVSGMNCIKVDQDRNLCWTLVNTVMEFQSPEKVAKFLSFWANCEFWRMIQLIELTAQGAVTEC
jgi:hypothetical protein